MVMSTAPTLVPPIDRSTRSLDAYVRVERESEQHVVRRRRRQTGPGGLTRRELEVLRLVSEGRSNKAVAAILWVTDQTVKFHLSNIYRKLAVKNRFEATRWARESGVLLGQSAGIRGL
jgi:DNA-binding CsgD family transcriptional regulator